MPVTSPARYQFGDGFELDLGAYELRRAGRAVKLPRIPMEVLLLLIEQRGNLVTREQIIERVWGKEIFVDTDNSINAAIRKLRRALRDDSETPRFVQTVTGRGYRFVASVSEVSAAAATGPAAAPYLAGPAPGPDSTDRENTDVAPREARRIFLAKLWAIFLIALLMLTGFALYRVRRVADSPAPNGKVMLAVLPFENLTGDATQDYFSDGMTEEMIADLGKLDPSYFGVIARTSVMTYKQSSKRVDQIGRELGVPYVIEGSVRRDSRNVRITAQLIQVKDQTHLWARQYDGDLRNVLSLQNEIARHIAEQVQLVLGVQPLANFKSNRIVAPSSDAAYESYDLYLKGRFFWNKRKTGFDQAADLFQRAIAADPTNARAYAGLADTWALMSTYFMAPQQEYMPKARTAALKALDLDSGLAEAHTSLALILESYDYDWKGAEQEFRKAIELNPDYATAHQWYAEHLAWRGRFDEAFAESERARQLDPLSVIIAADHCKIFFYSRQYDRALEHCGTVLQMDSKATAVHEVISASLIEQRKFSEAEQQITLATDNPVDLTWAAANKAYIYGRSGRTAEAQQFLANVQRHRADLGFIETPAMLLAFSGAGTADQVLELLEKAYSQHSNVLCEMKVNPMYDRFRSDPRFQELLHRVGLDQ